MDCDKLIMEHEWLNKDDLLDKLKSLEIDTRRYQTIVEFVFTDCVSDAMQILDDEFNSELGPPAYPRKQLLIIILFAEERGIDDAEIISQLCYTDDVFKIVAPTRKPSRNTIAKFLDCKNELPFLSVFLYTLVRMNDYDFLPKDGNNYIDSTDALVNASINYLISEDEIEALELMYKWNLIHDLSKRQISKVKTILKCKLNYYKNNPEITKKIGLILKRIKLYNYNVYGKIDEFKEVLEKNDKDYVPVNFPESVKIPSKRGKWDVGFNLHEIATSNSIILSGILQDKSNDQDSLKYIEETLKRNVELLIKLQKDYGERYNYKGLKKIFLDSNTFCDSGYDGEENNKYIQTSRINFIVLPKKLARQINNKLRGKSNKKSKNKKKNKTLKNEDDHSIKECERVVDGYICPFGNLIKLKDVVLKENKHNKQEDLPKPLLEYNYIHECSNCEGCPYFMKYNEKCSVAHYTEKSTQYHYELVNSFINGDFDDSYPKRFPVSEGINAYLKRKKSMLYLMGHNYNMANNHMHIKNILYNLVRFVKLKGSVC